MYVFAEVDAYPPVLFEIFPFPELFDIYYILEAWSDCKLIA